MDFEIGQEKTSNAPIPRDKLSELIKTSHEKSSIEQLVTSVLEQLNSHSSLYKYVVSVTTLETGSENVSNEACMMSNAIGASWNSRKDGLFNYELPDNEREGVKHLITVIWIAK